MAEEITYIPYGQNEISQQDLMTNLANGLPSFMQQYKWLQKPKNQEKFLKAYDDITKNLTGATDSSGRWISNVNNIDIDGMSPRDKEIYEHAAYYIQQQMSQMTPRAKEEEKKKEDLTPFKFTTDFNKYLLRGYGNSGEIFADPEQGWDAQDARGSNGLRGTEKRRAAMIKALQEYSDSLEDNKYNFEGTQFADLADAKAKIQTAINALKDTPNDESDDLPAFSALGLKYRSYFSNGGNDPYTKGDYNGTYQGYNDYLAEQEQAKQKAEQEKLKAQQANYWKGFKTRDFSKFNGRPLTTQESNIDYLNQLFAKPNISGDEASQIVSAFKLAEKNGLLVPLSKEEISKLNPSIWKNRTQYLRKIKDISTPLYYDTLNKQFKLFYDNQPTTSFQDILDQNNPEKIKEKKELVAKMAQDKYWNSPIKELDSYDYANVIGALADVASIIDPEPMTAAGIAEIGTAARAYGRSKDTGFWENALYTTGDTALGALAAIPGLGDAGLGMRLTGTGLKYLGYAGLLFNAKNLPDASKAFSKWYNYATQDGFHPYDAYKKLTRKEAQDLQNGILELVGLKGAVSGAIARKVTEPIRSTKQKVVDIDVKIKGNNTKIQVTPEEAKQLRTGLKGKLNKSNDKLRQQDSVQKYAKDNNIEVKDIELVSAPGRLPFTRNAGMSQRTITTEGTAQPKDFGLFWRLFAKNQTRPIFNSKNNNSDGIFNKFFGGYKPKNNSNNPTEQSLTPQQSSQQSPTQTTTVSQQSNSSEIKSPYFKEYSEFLRTGKIKHSGNHISETPFEVEGFKFDTNIIPGTTSGTIDISFKGKTETLSFKNKEEMSQKVANFLKEKRVDKTSVKPIKINHEKVGRILRELKRNGIFKQGGQINSLDKIIEDFINNNNI